MRSFSGTLLPGNFILLPVSKKLRAIGFIINSSFILLVLALLISTISFSQNEIVTENAKPGNPSSEWETSFSADEQEDYIYLIGNYTLLEDTLNKKASDRLFNEKLLLYKSSNYKMSKDELNYTEWTPIILRKHQDKMSKWACSAWKSNYIQNKS